MNGKQENKFSMAMSVRDTLDANTTIVNLVPAFTEAHTELSDVISEIDTLVQTQSQKTTAEDKKSAGYAAIEAALTIIAPAKAYALKNDKQSVVASFSYNRTELRAMRDTVLASTLKLVKDNATLLLADLADYGVTATMITELETALAKYNAELTKPTTSKASKSTATKSLDPAFKKMTKIFERMDNLVIGKRNTHPEFYTTYFEVRKIVNNKGGKKGKGGDAENGKDGNTPEAQKK